MCLSGMEMSHAEEMMGLWSSAILQLEPVFSLFQRCEVLLEYKYDNHRLYKTWTSPIGFLRNVVKFNVGGSWRLRPLPFWQSLTLANLQMVKEVELRRAK